MAGWGASEAGGGQDAPGQERPEGAMPLEIVPQNSVPPDSVPLNTLCHQDINYHGLGACPLRATENNATCDKEPYNF